MCKQQGKLQLNETEAFKTLYDVVVRLRSPGGCPWDLEQTPLTLRDDLVEETYECIEAIDQGDPAHIKEELGDILLLVLMLAYMHEQEGKFSTAETFEEAAKKLIRRHPHVFKPKDKGLSTDEVLLNWAKIKVEQEGRKPKDSILDEVSGGLPPLDKAWKLQKKAAKAGFDWPDSAGVIGKIKEEMAEVEAAIIATAGNTTKPGNATTPGNAESERKSGAANLEEELGDLLFSVVNLCRFFDVEPSVALQRTNSKFTERFKHVEKRMKETGSEMKAGNLEIMDQYWNEAKKR